MKLTILIALFLFLGFILKGQEVQRIIHFTDKIELTLDRSNFDTSGKKIEYTEEKYPICINGRPIFGTDGQMPKFQLSKATLKIGAQSYQLQVEDMYNPWFGDNPSNEEFKIIKVEYGYLLKGFFSDGAGSYYVEWLIMGKSSIRTLLKFGEDGFINCYFDGQYK